MDDDKIEGDQLTEDAVHSISATPLIARFHAKHNDSHFSPSEIGQHFEMPSFYSDQSDNERRNLEMQLMHAMIQDKELSAISFQRAVQRKQQVHSKIHQRRKAGSRNTMTFLLLGIIPVSWFVFVLTCAVVNLNIEYPE
jgi:hypothetical protein